MCSVGNISPGYPFNINWPAPYIHNHTVWLSAVICSTHFCVCVFCAFAFLGLLGMCSRISGSFEHIMYILYWLICIYYVFVVICSSHTLVWRHPVVGFVSPLCLWPLLSVVLCYKTKACWSLEGSYPGLLYHFCFPVSCPSVGSNITQMVRNPVSLSGVWKKYFMVRSKIILCHTLWKIKLIAF